MKYSTARAVHDDDCGLKVHPVCGTCRREMEIGERGIFEVRRLRAPDVIRVFLECPRCVKFRVERDTYLRDRGTGRERTDGMVAMGIGKVE